MTGLGAPVSGICEPWVLTDIVGAPCEMPFQWYCVWMTGFLPGVSAWRTGHGGVRRCGKQACSTASRAGN
jgi:hypothetical protein